MLFNSLTEEIAFLDLLSKLVGLNLEADLVCWVLSFFPVYRKIVSSLIAEDVALVLCTWENLFGFVLCICLYCICNSSFHLLIYLSHLLENSGYVTVLLNIFVTSPFWEQALSFNFFPHPGTYPFCLWVTWTVVKRLILVILKNYFL